MPTPVVEVKDKPSVFIYRVKRLIMGPGGDVHVDVAERAIAGIRHMLREKKIPQRADPGDALGEVC